MSTTTHDPITLEIIQNSLQATADEMFAAMRKTAMSSIIYEVLDMGTGITDAQGQLASSGANKFVFENVGLVEAYRPGTDPNLDLEAVAIEAGANDVKPLTHDQEDAIPKDATGAKFICERTDVATVSKWLSANGWTVVTAEIGFIPKMFPELTEEQLAEVGEFLQALEDNDDVHRVWAAVNYVLPVCRAVGGRPMLPS